MSDHKIQKPTLFISHAASDGDFANVMRLEIEKVFAKGVTVFCTSSPGAIGAGQDWLTDIEQKLESASAVIAIVTPVSIERPWLWFEIGATWGRGRSGDCHIYPVCAKEIELGNLPKPLDRLQALSMSKAADLKILFQSLIQQFGFGEIKSFRATNITSRIPKYENVKIDEADLNDRVFYSGKYSGYSDDELMEVIDTELVAPHESKSQYSSFGGREDLIHNGKLIHYRQVDKSLQLPPGTARRLLSKVAARYKLEPYMEKDNIVRYRNKPK